MEKEQLITSGKCGDNLTWRFKKDTLYIEGSGAMYDSHWSENTREWEDVKTSIKRIVIQEGCTYIGEFVFCGCSNLRDVSIPNSVECIGYAAFSDCGNIQSVLVPDAFIRLAGDAGDCNCYMHPLLNRERFIINVFPGETTFDETTWTIIWDMSLEIQLRKKDPQKSVADRCTYYLNRKTGSIIRDFCGKSDFGKINISDIGGIYNDWHPTDDAMIDLEEISAKNAKDILNRLLLQSIDQVKLKEMIAVFEKGEFDINWRHRHLVTVVKLLGFEDYYGMYLDDWDEEKLVPQKMDAWQIRVCISRIFAEFGSPWLIRDRKSLTEQSIILEMLLRLDDLLSSGSV